MARRIKKHDHLREALTEEKYKMAIRMAKKLDFRGYLKGLEDEDAGLSLKESLAKRMEEDQRLWK